MPAPSAAYIASLLGRHQQFKPDSSGAIALAGLAEQRQGRKERSRQFDLENARADEYLGFQQHQYEQSQANRKQDNLVQAFKDFNDAVVDGDEERARAAASIIQAYGGSVEEYEGEPAGGGVAPSPPATAAENPATGGAAAAVQAAAPQSAMSVAAKQSPTAKVAQGAAKAPPAPAPAPSPPPAEPPAWLKNEAVKEGWVPQGPGLDTGPFQGLPPATLDRPSPAGGDPLAMLTPEQRQALLAALSGGLA